MSFKKRIAGFAIIVMMICLFDVGGFTTLESKAAEDKVSVVYQAHSQTYGWFPEVGDGLDFAGITGRSKRMECVRIKLVDPSTKKLYANGGIEYQVHCQSYGWLKKVSNGADAGTVGSSKRLEAIKIRLTGEIAKKYDVYYRVHCQTYGWMNWVKNWELAGTEGQAKRLEAIEIKLVLKSNTNTSDNKKDDKNNNDSSQAAQPVNLKYRTHVQKYGWMNWVANNKVSGTEGEAKRLEGIEIKVDSSLNGGSYAGIVYRVHSQSYGWLPWVRNGEMAGIVGQSKRMEAIQIYLTGDVAKNYDIYYRVHCQSFGWLDWAKNGGYAGSSGYSKRLEAIKIIIKKKGSPAPGNTTRPYVCNGTIPTPAVPDGINPDGSIKGGDDKKDNNDKDDKNGAGNDVPNSTDDESGRSIEEILNGARLDYYSKTNDPIIDNRVKTILSQIINDKMSTFEKTKAIYDWIIANNRYMVDYGGWRISKSYQSIFDTWCANQSYSSLLLGFGSCKNYSAAFVVLTRAIGLESFKVCGLAPGQRADRGDEHGWAVIRINGKYYHFDPQLGDIVDGGGYGNTYDYFGKTNNQFIKMGFQLCGDGDGSFEAYIKGFNYFR